MWSAPLLSHAASAVPDAVRKVTLEPLAPTRTAIGPCGSCSRVAFRHRLAGLPASVCPRRTTETLVRICGDGASRWTLGGRAGLPSTSSAGGRSSPEQPAPAATTIARRHATAAPEARATSRAPARSPDAGVARAPAVGARPDARAVVLALRLDDLVGSVGVRGVDQADVAVA